MKFYDLYEISKWNTFSVSDQSLKKLPFYKMRAFYLWEGILFVGLYFELDELDWLFLLDLKLNWFRFPFLFFQSLPSFPLSILSIHLFPIHLSPISLFSCLLSLINLFILRFILISTSLHPSWFAFIFILTIFMHNHHLLTFLLTSFASNLICISFHATTLFISISCFTFLSILIWLTSLLPVHVSHSFSSTFFCSSIYVIYFFAPATLNRPA